MKPYEIFASVRDNITGRFRALPRLTSGYTSHAVGVMDKLPFASRQFHSRQATVASIRRKHDALFLPLSWEALGLSKIRDGEPSQLDAPEER